MNSEKQARKLAMNGAAACMRPVIRATETALRAMRAAYRKITGAEAPVIASAPAARGPAVPVEMSVTPDYIVCLEDGRRFKMLKGHLRAAYDLSPRQYREKWGLPEDYPMVAPNYREKRAEMAREMGLGHMRRTKPADEDGQKAA